MTVSDKPLKVIQVLPSLNSGGVERGTMDFARFLVQHGHESTVMSAGGRLVKQLQEEGSKHLVFPIHRKSPLSFLKVPKLRRLLVSLTPDVIHVRSRMPAWMIWRALKRWPLLKKPALVSTFHGLYSVSFYSAIMGCGDQVIAISECVRDYIVENYPKISPNRIHVIHRGVDAGQFNTTVAVSESWRQQFAKAFPNSIGKHLLLMPGRLSSWKGQRDFITLVSGLVAKGVPVYGLIVGETTPGKESYVQELRATVMREGLSRHVGFAGHRDDMETLYKAAAVVFNLSQHAEPFGRTVIEALAVGTPVVAYNYGGPAESLRHCLPAGLIPIGDQAALIERTAEFIEKTPQFVLPEQFTLDYQARATVNVYNQAIASRAD